MGKDDREADAPPWARRLRAHWEAQTPDFDAQRTWVGLEARLRRERSTWQRLRAWAVRPLGAGALGFGAGAACAFLAAVLVWGPSPSRDGGADFTPLAGAQRPSSTTAAHLQVVFRPTARVAEIEALLGSLGLEVVAGPGALGVWVVAVAPTDAERVRQALQQAAAVQSVELAAR
jgi:hypothetical protein